MSSSLYVRLRRLASGLGSLSLDGGVAQLLDFALLAVLRARQSPALSPIVRLSPPPWLSTHLPLGEPELAHATALGNDALVLLERAAHDARGDRNVAVVAVTSCQRRGSGRREGSWAYERPAAFHANAIVMVGRVFVGVGFAGCGWGWRCWIEDSREPFGARPSSRARDMAEQLPAYLPTSRQAFSVQQSANVQDSSTMVNRLVLYSLHFRSRVASQQPRGALQSGLSRSNWASVIKPDGPLY
jgi:hypothetical protein